MKIEDALNRRAARSRAKRAESPPLGPEQQRSIAARLKRVAGNFRAAR